MSVPQHSLVKNDSLAFEFSLKKKNGTLVPLAGYVVTLAIPTAVPPLSVVGTLLDATTSLVNIPPDAMSAAGVFPGTIRAVNASTSDAHTYSFDLVVADR